MIVFIGPSGAGKSRLGKRVARLLGVPFTDTDRVIIAEHGPIPQIFQQHGEAHFRALERDAVRRGLQGDGILSLGGGAILDPDTQRDLADHRVVFLTISPEAVARRLAGDTDRPLVRNGVDDWIALNAPRWEIYERLADATFDTSHRPNDELAKEVAAWLTTT
ncbi:shikimate kinase [Pseudolysinimonas yzui]|uniref:Shikimate kinase n=1 Tax=Pseudolysinimonas yzui TaxID=2708254 RepID=A0A8J3GNU1_9MICO|nr:shikimate kinase [Pseudolysinimonas yzui]GHF08809.1 shikimate kinase [Pseudolysinimonas yzui]